MKRIVAAAILVLAGAVGRVSADATVRAEVSAQKIGVQDQVELTITVEGAGFRLLEEVAVPKLQNLRVVGGPSVSTQVQLVNGAMSQSRSATWILQPLAVGKAEVGAAKARLEGGDRSSEPIALDVAPGSVRPATRPRAPDPFANDPFEQAFGGRRGATREPKVTVEAAVARNRLRVGEPLVLTYWLYTQTSVTDLQFVDPPQYPGFWAEDLERPKTSNQGEAAMLGGESYRRFPVFLKLLFPTRAGKLKVPATRIRLGLPRQGFFDTGGVLERESKEVEVTVDPLPETAGFSGAVGRFRAAAALDKATVAVGDAATLRFKVEGTGNLKWIDKAPELLVPGAKVYPPQVKSDLKAGATGIAGSRTWEFVVVPETAGDLQVPALRFDYFDPATGKIETAATSALPLRVEGGTAASGAPLAPAPATLSSRAGGILPLRGDLDLRTPLVPHFGPALLAVGAGVTLALHLLLWSSGRFWGRRVRRGAASRGRGQSRSVRAAIADLDRVGRDGLTKEAEATLIARALHEAFGPLDDPSAEGEGEEKARALLEEVQFVRYAPQLGDYSEKLRDLAARAAETMRRWA